MDPFPALNEQQREAVEHGIGGGGLCTPPGPLLVIAGAGSGKTLTLAARVARLVLAGADPRRLLLLTFSRRAAQDMQRRVGRTLHQSLGLRSTQPAPQLPWAGTFHGIGARLLREYAAQIGLAENFTILDRGDAEDVLGLIRHELRLGGTRERFPLKATCLAIYSRAVNSTLPLGDVLARAWPWCGAWEAELKRLFSAYAAEKEAQRVLDYDDLLLYWSQMMQMAPALAAHLGARFDHVLVDEYQDTNRLQAEILQALKPDGRGVMVVGDDAQSIYGFRAAEVRNILDFPARFEPPARVVTLERNYRSTQPILEASNRVIALAPERYAKRLWSDATAAVRPSLVTVGDEAAQAEWVADQVLRHREAAIPLKRQAVLFRSAHHAAALEIELARRNIPFVKFGGLKFLEAAHVKDVLSLLRWAQNPRHRLAGLRVAQRVDGIGVAGAKRLLDAMTSAAQPVEVLRAHVPPRSARDAWPAFVDTFERLSDGALRWPAALDSALDWYLPQLDRLHDDAMVRAGDLRQLRRIAEGYGSRESFLAELTLDPPEATSDEAGAPLIDEDYLILSTIHSAKGQEWQSVFVLNVIDGCMPSDLATGRADEIEEERRLLYVAMTRARRHLHLVAPQRFHVTQQTPLGDRHLWGGVSRFIPPQLLDAFESFAGADGPESDERRPRAGGAEAPLDLAADTAFAVSLSETIRLRWA